jgi:hypothetical protein
VFVTVSTSCNEQTGTRAQIGPVLYLTVSVASMYLQRILTYLLIPWSRVLLEKPTGFHLVKKFPALYGTRWLITAVTSARHLSLA